MKCTIIGVLLIQLHSCKTLGCLEKVKISLLKLKASLIQELRVSELSSWRNGGESDCCEWEGVGCDNTRKRVTQLWLNGLFKKPLVNEPLRVEEEEEEEKENGGYLREYGWSLNVSLFIPFEDLQVLDLSSNYLAGSYLQSHP